MDLMSDESISAFGLLVAEAAENDVILLRTPLPTYEAAGKLWEAGIR